MTRALKIILGGATCFFMIAIISMEYSALENATTIFQQMYFSFATIERLMFLGISVFAINLIISQGEGK